MSTIGEIREALGVLAFGYINQRKTHRKRPFGMHSQQIKGRPQSEKKSRSSLYVGIPGAPDEVNLHAMASLKAAFGTAVGLSDHSEGIYAAVVAAALGRLL